MQLTVETERRKERETIKRIQRKRSAVREREINWSAKFPLIPIGSR